MVKETTFLGKFQLDLVENDKQQSVIVQITNITDCCFIIILKDFDKKDEFYYLKDSVFTKIISNAKRFDFTGAQNTVERLQKSDIFKKINCEFEIFKLEI